MARLVLRGSISGLSPSSGQKAALNVGTMAAGGSGRRALSRVAALQPGPANDVTVYNTDRAYAMRFGFGWWALGM
jgi:hypothetical protein